MRIAILALALLAGGITASAVPTYTMTVLPIPSDVEWSEGTDLNDNGEAVGLLYYHYTTGAPPQRVRWTAAGYTIIPLSAGDPPFVSALPRINNAGYVTSQQMSGEYSWSLLFSPAMTAQPIGPASSSKNVPFFLNNKNDTIILDYTPTPPVDDFYIFRRANGTMYSLNTYWPEVQITGLNDSGQLIGRYHSGNTDQFATWNTNTWSVTHLAYRPILINNKGNICCEDGKNLKYFEWGSQWVTVTLPPHDMEHLRGMNDAGDVVGWIRFEPGVYDPRAVLIERSTLQTYDLNDRVSLLTRSAWRIAVANDINNKGQILAVALHLRTQKYRTVILTPVP
jgi:hypothetical protein